jgi:membrane protease YdiL (CAAX protease family)
LVSLRFAQDGGEDAPKWKDEALAALARVSEAGRENPYYRFLEKAVTDIPLAPKEQQDWEAYTQERNADWWTGFLATRLQVPDTVDRASLQQAQTDALAGYVKAALLIITLSILGLLALPAAWLTLARSRPAIAFSNDRLFRLWQGPKVTGVFALSGLAAFGLNHFFSGDIYPLATALLGNVADAYTAWWAGMWIWLGWAVAMVALPILPLCVSFAPTFSRLTRVFGFTGTDFATVRYVSFALVGMGLLPWGFQFLDAGLSYLGASSSILDGLSRSFSELDTLALPLSVFWGVILAPFVEEIIFRGFIFRAVQVRWGTAVGMVVSSAIFAGTHFYSLNGTLHVFFYGLLFAWLYQRTGKLAASMIVHGAGNLALILVAHFTGG